MKILKIVDKNKKYVSKTNNKEYVSTHYYIVLDNGKYIPIMPTFKQGYAQLDTICETVING